jgi:hypothetical protein
MQNLRPLNEGLRENDLRETILKEISIDLFQPRAGDEDHLIVVGFEMIDEGPANDLEEFIRTGALDIIDTDVSPGPTTNGTYMVFCEFKRDKSFPLQFLKLLTDIKNVVSTNEWSFKGFPRKEIVELTPENLLKEVILDSTKYHEAKEIHDKEAAAESFVVDELARDHFISEGRFHIITNDKHTLPRTVSYEIYTVGNIDVLLESDIIKNKPIRFDNPRILRLQKMFGPCYNVNNIGKYIVIQNSHGQAMALKTENENAQ